MAPRAFATGKRPRTAEAILNRGLGKVAELPDEKKQAFAFFQQATPEQIALAEKLVDALPANTDGNPKRQRSGIA
jgi:hypothetical protein